MKQKINILIELIKNDVRARILFLVVFIFVLFFSLLIIYLQIAIQRDLRIVMVTPQEDSTSGLYPDISATFDKEVNGITKSRIKIPTSPSIEGDVYWSKDNKSITIAPSQALVDNKTYSVSLSFPNGSASWTFKTISQEESSLKDQGRLQSEADHDAGLFLEKLEDQYPWLNDFPIETSLYFIAFVPQENKFYVSIYIDKTKNISEQENRARKEISEVLKSKGIDEKKHTFSFENI